MENLKVGIDVERFFISDSSSNPKLSLFKPSLNTDVRKKIGITQ